MRTIVVMRDALPLLTTRARLVCTIEATSFDSLVNEQRVEICFCFFNLTIFYDYFFLLW